MAEASTRFFVSLAIVLAVVISVSDAARIAPDDLLPSTATAGVLLSQSTKSGARSLLQIHRASPAETTSAQAVKQASTTAALNAFIAADAAQLKLMQQGDKQAEKRATIRYYWLIACNDADGISAADFATEQIALTREMKQYVAAGVVDTRIKVLKAVLALVEAKLPNKAQCIKYDATGVSAGYQAAALLGGAVTTTSPELWKIDMEILPDELDKLMPINAGSSAKRGM